MQKAIVFITGLILAGFLLSAIPIQAANEHTFSDPTGDVLNMDAISGEGQVITTSPYLNIDNIDITDFSYSDNGAGKATLILKVANQIENRGKLLGDNFDNFDMSDLQLNTIEYGFYVFTNESTYNVIYSNNSCQVVGDLDTVNITTFTVSEDTLTITFSFTSPTEQYDGINATANYLKVNFSGIKDFNNLSDEDIAKLYIIYEDDAPNPALAIDSATAESNLAAVGKNLQFNCSVMPFSGLPPYTYRWTFGDGTSSTNQNPIHAYTATGNYTFSCTVTDWQGTTATESGHIKIESSSGNSSSSNMVMIFIAIIVIIAIAGVAIVIYLIRR
jgi:PKD repeat protein